MCVRIVDTVCLLCKSDVILCSVKIESWSATCSSLVFVVSDHLACCHLLIEVNCVVVSSGIQMVSWFMCVLVPVYRMCMCMLIPMSVGHAPRDLSYDSVKSYC